MADYKAIKGHNIETVAGDPSVLQAGDIWYSNTTRKIRGVHLATTGSWSTGGTLNSARRGAAMTGETNTAAHCFGGELPATTDNSEEYDGSSWTEGDNMNDGRQRLGGCGTQTAGFAVGGESPSPNPKLKSETYNGSSWTEAADYNTARAHNNVFGTTTAAVNVGGTPGSITACEEFNGTSWTEVTDLPAHIYGGGTAGTISNGMVFAGQPPPFTRSFEYDGTNWTAGGALNQGKHASNGFGESQTTATNVTGSVPTPTVVANTEEYDGSSWTEVADLSTAREASAANGTRASAIVAAGAGTDQSPDVYNLTEEWDKGATAASFTSS